VLLSITFLAQLNASEITPIASPAAFDNNISSEYLTDENTTITAKSWFYYRAFVQLYEQHVLTHVDRSYLYGTDAVIVVGSGVDYFLANLVDKYNSAKLHSDTNTTRPRKKKARNFFKDGYSNKNSEELEQYLLSNIGKETLPRQFYTQEKRTGERTYLISEWFDDRSINNSFLDRNNRSYVRLRGGYAYSYRGDDAYLYSITARLKIPRTQEKLDLIVGDDTKYSSDLSLDGTEAQRDNSIALGLNNLFGLLEPVKTKLRLGFSGILNPYAKASFDYQALFGHWLIVPQQTFRYSVENDFEEWTNLSFSRRMGRQMMFSVLMQRSTQSTIDGMNYFAQPALNFTLGRYGNFTPYLGVYGRTQAQPEEDGYTPPPGIYRYAIGLNWSKQAKRKYIVYRLQPILSYDDQYAFKPEYFLKGLLEFYFGLRD